jgi:lactoylglutathione lyase
MALDLALRSLQHVGIPVTDLARSIAFYEALSFRVAMRSQFEHDGATGHVAMLQYGDGAATITLELYQMPEPALADIRARRDGHIDHIAFDVADIDATFEALRAAGYATIEPAPVTLPFWRRGCRYCYIVGPDGERLEFNQML